MKIIMNIFIFKKLQFGGFIFYKIIYKVYLWVNFMNRDCYVLLQNKWQIFKKFVSVCKSSLQYINITFWWDLSLQFIVKMKIFVTQENVLEDHELIKNCFYLVCSINVSCGRINLNILFKNRNIILPKEHHQPNYNLHVTFSYSKIFKFT